MGETVIYACDVGSIAGGNFAWTSSARGKRGSIDINELVAEITRDIRSGGKIAIGFECPLFIPCPVASSDIGKARDCDGNKAYTSSVGASVAMTGLSQVAWILNEIHKTCPNTKAATSQHEFLNGEADILVWEAFVTGESKGKDHVQDAYIAMRAFQLNQEAEGKGTGDSSPNPMSFAGAIILWSGMASDPSLLRTPCIVIKP